MYFSIKTGKDKLGVFLIAIGLIYLLIATYTGIKYSMALWIDEFYTVNMIYTPFSLFVERGIGDVHPLLYYLIFKVIYKVFLLFGFDNIFIVGKIVSLIPFYLIVVLGLTKIKNKFGLLASGLFILCICSMPQLMHYAVELRMYSWGLFFVTSSLVYAIEVMDDSNLKNWILLTVFTICSAYTHYYAAIASFSIYLMLLIYFIKQNRKPLKNWLISTIISVLAFSPWILIVAQQTSNISANYWIKPITIQSVIGYVFYILSPANPFIKGNEVVSPSLLAILILIGFIYLIYKNRNKYNILAIGTFILVPVIGIIISQIIRPFFVPRYLIPSLGCLWLAFAILLASEYKKNKKVFYIILALILITSAISCVNFYEIQKQDNIYVTSQNTYANELFESGDIIIADKIHSFSQLKYYNLPDNEIIFYENGDFNNILNETNITPNSNGKIYFVDAGTSDEKYLNESILEYRKMESNGFAYRTYEIVV